MAGIPYPALPLADVCFSYFLGFSALKGNGLPASIPSLLLHGWAPAGFPRGLRRCCFYMDSHGGGEEVSGRERLHIVSTRLFFIGNRYTVYGFDGEYTLMGESGWYLRNEISSDIPSINSSLYLGLDGGAVYGPGTDVLAGRTIAGMALGLRGSFPSGLTYDGFISRSLYKPDGFHTRKWVPEFTVSCWF